MVSVVLLLFSLLHLIPGDPATIALGPRATPEVIERYRDRMHLDEPLPVQFLIFAGNVLQGDLGTDVFSGRSVGLMVWEQLGFTLALVFAGLGWAVLLGIPLGVLAAVRPNSWFDRVTGVISVGTIAVPSFLVSIWAILIFSIWLGWLPAIGAGEPGDTLDQLVASGPSGLRCRSRLGRLSRAHGARLDARGDGRELHPRGPRLRHPPAQGRLPLRACGSRSCRRSR